MVAKDLGVPIMAVLMILGRRRAKCVPIVPRAIRELGMGSHVRRQDTERIRMLKEWVLQYLQAFSPMDGATQSSQNALFVLF